MRWLMLPLLQLLLLLQCSCVFASEYCKPVNNTKGVELPYIPKSYQTRIEMNNVMKNETLEFEEWLDGDNGNVRVRLFQKNSEIDDFIFHNASRQIYAILNGVECLVSNMSDADDLNLLFGINGRVVASAKQVLRFSKEFGMEYRNRTTIRNEAVDHWYSCQRWPERKAEFEVDWYFSVRQWNTPYDRNLPVRAEVKGEAGDVSNRHRFHLIYDFAFFRDTLMVSNRIFDTPPGIYCQNRRSLKKPPKLPQVMSYTQEVLVSSPNLEFVQYGNIHYDAGQSLVKYQYRDAAFIGQPPFYNLGSLTVVQDFNTGVSYFIDDLIGNCTDRPIGAEFFDVAAPEIKGKPGWFLVEMRSPMDLFRIDDSYQFTGKRISRGVPVDRYISVRSDYPIKGRSDLNFTFEYEFLDPLVAQLVLGNNKLNEGSNVPMRLRISNYKKLTDIVDPTFDYREEYNFYNFDTQMFEKPSEDFDKIQPYDLDVTRCYTKEERKNVLIRFLNAGTYDAYVKDERNLFLRRAAEILSNSNLGLVNPLRFQRLRLDYDSTFIYLIFTMLGGPHPYAQFHQLSARNVTVENADAASSVASELECLQRCNSIAAPACNSAAYCPGSPSGSNCLLSSSFKRDTANRISDHPCTVFVRPVAVSRPGSSEASVESAYSLLVDFVESDMFRVPMESLLPEDSGYPKYANITAVDVEQFQIRPNVDQALNGRNLFKFSVQHNKGLKPQRPAYDDVAIDECAETCLGDPGSDCKSFTYCYGLGQCFLHSDSPADKPAEVVTRARCNLYDKNQLASFDKEPGVSRVEGADRDFQFVDSDRDCAAACLAKDSCRSFDNCDLGAGKQMCYLSSSHRLDASSKASLKVNCTHFSRSYTADFHLDFVVANPDLSPYPLRIADVNADACSRLCAEQFGERCNGFYHCAAAAGRKPQCVVREPGLPRVTAQGIGKPDCSYYSRAFDLDGKKWIPRNEKVVPGTFHGVSVLNVLVVAAVLLIAGLLAGVAAVAIFLRLRARPLQMEEPQVQFSR